MILTVGPCGDYALVSEALADCEMLLPQDIEIFVEPGFYLEQEIVRFTHPFGHKVKITGAPTLPLELKSVVSVSGYAGSWDVIIEVSDSSNVCVGSIVQVLETAGSNKHELHRGAWKVLSIQDANHIKVKVTSNLQPPYGTITGIIKVFKTQINFSSGGGFIFSGLGGFSNCAVVGDVSQNSCGIWNGFPDAAPLGKTHIGPNLAIIGFGAEGVRANYGGVIIAEQCVSSGNGNNGFMARDTGQLKLDNCTSSGNGVLASQIPGGGNGFLSQDTSSIYAFYCQALGNFGDGFYSRMSSNILCDNSGPCLSAGNYNGFRASLSSTLQSIGSIVRYVTWNAFKVEYNANMLVSSSSVIGAYNGACARNGATIDVSSTYMSSITSTPYYADGNATVVMSNPAGLPGSYPPANTARSNVADFGKVIN